MKAWRDSPLRGLLGIAHPILQAPMAGAQGHELAVAVAAAGGLGAVPCALLKPEQVREEVAQFRRLAPGQPLNLNFFCHTTPAPDEAREQAWRLRLRPYYLELGVDPEGPIPVSNRNPFDAAACVLVEELRPEVVSFHFGLPEPALLARVKAAGAKVLASATTPAEARWLAARGVDAVIAQGSEAGGHRGVFLRDEVYSQIGTFALVPQVVDAAGGLPVIAAGGIADERGIRAALALGAAGVQIGTAYLLSPQAKVSAPHRAALQDRERVEVTALTNLFSGRPARSVVNRLMRELGPLSDAAPAFPLAGGALTPLRAPSEARGSGDFMSLWSGQAAALARAGDAGEVTRAWAAALDSEA
ncbi:nitronate monooxygenase family protein [Paucibacter sp. R3-3]|uniref:Propionate 3-nitronate monooxygenase n=1 Tax=Roseateles agri TaxID=3098619 RepID=A0ABU5DAX1_9BURK|nr:nitronate monooxygenase family protein [Paucibacter sp. R3-3]MDY0743411.1 nitronate monooxygenase family protein [Paucibacter sp. R3-3]